MYVIFINLIIEEEPHELIDNLENVKITVMANSKCSQHKVYVTSLQLLVKCFTDVAQRGKKMWCDRVNILTLCFSKNHWN